MVVGNSPDANRMGWHLHILPFTATHVVECISEGQPRHTYVRIEKETVCIFNSGLFTQISEAEFQLIHKPTISLLKHLEQGELNLVVTKVEAARLENTEIWDTSQKQVTQWSFKTFAV